MKKLPSIDSEEFLPYLQEKASNHHSYKMYNQIDVVNSTIDNKALYLSTGNDWNDVVDRNNFNNDKLTMLNFGRCFSYSTTESVAMWMLYGGMKHKGAMIDFDKSSISEILRNTKQIRVGFFENKEFHSLRELTKQEFEIELIDVVYVEKKDSDVIIRRTKDDVWKLTDFKDFGKRIQNNEKYTFIHKSKAWDYEQECRLIISIRKDILLGVDDYDKINKVEINLQNINLKNTRRIYAPNISEDEYKKDPEFAKAFPSALRKEVNWDLCNGCK
jgi:hypothetical protein